MDKIDLRRIKNELTDKPGSVEDNHSSGMSITTHLKRPTRIQRGTRLEDSYLVLLRVGFTIAANCYQLRGALLPHLFTLTYLKAGGILSAALSVGSRPPGVTWHSTLWSPDFPPLAQHKMRTRRDCLVSSGGILAI